MTELVSAMTRATTILSRSIRQIAATRIQRTWKSWRIHRESGIQRAQARLHKFENSNDISWKNGSANQIKDLLEGMEMKKKGTTITFGGKNRAQDGKKTFFEEMNGEDGKMKSQTIFTYMVNTWCSHLGEKSTFFDKGFGHGGHVFDRPVKPESRINAMGEQVTGNTAASGGSIESPEGCATLR